MLVPLLLSVALVGPPRVDDVPVRVRLNHEQLEVGDRARVYIKTARDGFLVILHADPQGRVRVLFPIDPDADNFVRGGKELELLSRSEREALQIDAEGSGTVLAAFSVDAFQFDELTRNGHWDFLALGGPDESVKNDPLAGLLEIVNNMARDHEFDYDVATYFVGSAAYASGYDYHGHGYGHTHVGIHFGFGYYPFGFGVAYGYCAPFCYDPFWYGGFAYGYPYSPYGWGGGYGYGYGYPIYRTPVSHTAAFGGFNRKEPSLPRFEPTQPRVRNASMGGGGIGDRRGTIQTRSIQPRGGQARSVEPRSVAPRGRAVAPRSGGTQSRPSVGPRPRASSGGRSISRPSGGGRSFGGTRGGG
ncbi:MAG TPA: DUF4384 domain-containing protein, partial [Gemmatimonadales bacterium]|nr:DUF4384 domain-containing protein [Gemmatimonadales bacterium]